MDIQAILAVGQRGLTRDEISTKSKLTRTQGYAITNWSAGLTVEQIKKRLLRINSDMSAREIKTLMSAD